MANENTALALSTVAIVTATYGAALPNMAEARSQADDAGHLRSAETYAALVSVSLVLGVAAVTRSSEVAAAGVIAVVAMSAAYRVSVRTLP